ncbi:MAG: hypothetical protein GY851_04745 [bacterium]|nr:hypothetical protein [bacterium]
MRKTTGLRKRLRRLALGAICTLLVIVASSCAWSRYQNRRDLLSVDVDGRPRGYLFHQPAGRSPSETLPLVVALHGFLDTPGRMRDRTHFNELADRERFFVVYPEGEWRRWKTQPRGEEGLEDIRFIETLLDHLQETHPIDRNRVYVTGLSAGGMMTHLVGCALADRVAAIAPVMGTITPDAVAYANARAVPVPMPVLMIHGDEDSVVKWEGDSDKWYGQPGYRSVPQTVSFWVSRNNAQPEARVRTLAKGQLSADREVTKTLHPGNTGGAEVVLHTIEGAGHKWPGGDVETEADPDQPHAEYDASETVWRFFEQHARP